MEKLPENDPDLQLSREIGREAPLGNKLSKMDDMPFLKVLLSYRKHIQQHEASIPADGRDAWANIEKAITPAKVHYLRTNTWIWMSAAIILIAAFVTFFYININNQPALLANSGSQIELFQLRDGSSVILKPQSRLYELQYNDSQQRYLLQGEGYFSVSEASDRLFSVETEYGEVRVLGTRFIVREIDMGTEVFLEKGSVHFNSRNGENPVILQPGQAISYSSSEGISQPQFVDSNSYLAWTRDELFFNSQTVRFVLNELEQHFGITIHAPEQVLNDVLGGAVSLKSLRQSLNDLGAVLNGNFETKDDETYMFIPD